MKKTTSMHLTGPVSSAVIAFAVLVMCVAMLSTAGAPPAKRPSLPQEGC